MHSRVPLGRAAAPPAARPPRDALHARQNMLGMVPGEERCWQFVFPDDWHVELWRGQAATATIKLLELFTYILPQVWTAGNSGPTAGCLAARASTPWRHTHTLTQRRSPLTARCAPSHACCGGRPPPLTPAPPDAHCTCAARRPCTCRAPSHLRRPPPLHAV